MAKQAKKKSVKPSEEVSLVSVYQALPDENDLLIEKLKEAEIESYRDPCGVIVAKLDTKEKYDLFMSSIRPTIKNSFGYRCSKQLTAILREQESTKELAVENEDMDA